jgi:hypothetical protein
VKITHLRSATQGDRARVAATVIWEDCDRPQREVYFETDSRFADGLACNPDAFLTMAIPPAFYHGEKRVFIEGEICPELRSGLMTCMAVLRDWHKIDRDLITIEAKNRSRLLAPRPPERAAFFFTGGIDSLSTLRANRLNYPSSHPSSIKDGIFVCGFDTDKPETFHNVVNYLSPLAKDARVTLVPVYTNERYLDDDWLFWLDFLEGAALSAAAHVLSNRLTLAFIASSWDIPNLHPIASHPLLDPNYSSGEVRIRHDNAALTRLEKTGILAGWDTALRHLRVCNKVQLYTADRFNCGACEKCVRTMLGLYIYDALERTPAFPPTRLTEELIREVVCLDRTSFRYWPELIAPLKAKGRVDLARGIQYALDRYYGEKGLAGPFKRLDRVLFKDSLRELKRNVVGKRRKKK